MSHGLGEIGGGEHYDNKHISGDAEVSTLSEIQTELSNATSGDVVYIDPSATIDVSSSGAIDIPDGVTLASDRGVDGSDGATIDVTSVTDPPAIDCAGVAEGFEIAGPKPDYTAFDDRNPSGGGIRLLDGGEVGNCLIHHFGFGGVTVDGASAAHVHHCVIRDHAVEGHGYGIIANAGAAE